MAASNPDVTPKNVAQSVTWGERGTVGSGDGGESTSKANVVMRQIDLCRVRTA